MGIYKDKISYKPHDFNTSTLLINEETKGESVDSIKIEYIEDRYTEQTVADGSTIMVRNASRAGIITIGLLEGSPTCTTLWDLIVADSEDGISLSFSDTAVPDLKASSANCYAMKPPDLVRQQEHNVVEFTFKAAYVEMKGGGYALVAST